MLAIKHLSRNAEGYIAGHIKLLINKVNKHRVNNNKPSDSKDESIFCTENSDIEVYLSRACHDAGLTTEPTSLQDSCMDNQPDNNHKFYIWNGLKKLHGSQLQDNFRKSLLTMGPYGA